jgi:hypothetical protein
MTVTATFRFYPELNDFLVPARRHREFTCRCAPAATTKHMIEALGVPHTEVELVLVNGESVSFERGLGDGSRDESTARPGAREGRAPVSGHQALVRTREGQIPGIGEERRARGHVVRAV